MLNIEVQFKTSSNIISYNKAWIFHVLIHKTYFWAKPHFSHKSWNQSINLCNSKSRIIETYHANTTSINKTHSLTFQSPPRDERVWVWRIDISPLFDHLKVILSKPLTLIKLESLLHHLISFNLPWLILYLIFSFISFSFSTLSTLSFS
jgi:hypothetical protein